VESWGSGRLDVFIRGTDDRLYHRFWDASAGSTWSSWEDLGGTLKSDPVVVSWGPGRIDVFARAKDDHLWHKAWNGSVWEGWEWLGGPITSSPSVVSTGAGKLDVFVLGTSATTMRRWYDGVWHP
jgi:hypothetical protein